ncbi:MAG: YraN family protein [Microbacteriaceae bacterium]|nr:YraN family protein [Microbacteriaceae bacterium]MCI1207160.1 YraN family protein [Microbacteriaceae bacterium]
MVSSTSSSASSSPRDLSPAELGRYGENLAVQALLERGLTPIDRNWRCSRGELDLVAREGKRLVFVEVKTRRGTRQGGPAAAVTPAKVLRLRLLAGAWLRAHPGERAQQLRIDVIAILIRGDRAVLHYIEGVA